jgi:hypothetical protein
MKGVNRRLRRAFWGALRDGAASLWVMNWARPVGIGDELGRRRRRSLGVRIRIADVAARVPVHRPKNGRAPRPAAGLLHLFGPPSRHLRAAGPGAGPGARRFGARHGLSRGGQRVGGVYAYLREREQPTETYFETSRDPPEARWEGRGFVPGLPVGHEAQPVGRGADPGAAGGTDRRRQGPVGPQHRLPLRPRRSTCARTACATWRWRSC